MQATIKKHECIELLDHFYCGLYVLESQRSILALKLVWEADHVLIADTVLIEHERVTCGHTAEIETIFKWWCKWVC